MKRLLPALALLGAACSGDSTGPSFKTVADLAGRWNLAGLMLVGVQDTTLKLDVKSALSLSGTLSIAADGRAILTASAQGTESTDTATIAFRGDTLVYTRTRGSPLAYVVRGAGRTMIWTAVQTDEFFDLNGDGSPDESREIDTWQRL